ncbi:MAG: transglutaminase domain-containing protein [Candidatus Omnitrophica bacterium]|nr:transglutaminase domain-containing protein [Candidatus Omnitrophota bacterium]
MKLVSYGVLLIVCVAVQSSYAAQDTAPMPEIVTGDIQEQIEKHIAEKVEEGEGYFHLRFEGKDLTLNLVRVHVEYLASLSPTRHFACVDMVGADGEFYDVDFFMEGTRNDMRVTETTVHKINGQSIYVWKQAEDKTWERVPVADASADLLGVINDRDHFEFRYETTLPAINTEAKVWIPLATSDAFQTIKIKSINGPSPYQILKDRTEGNVILYFECGPDASGKSIVITYDVERREKNAYEDDPSNAQRYLNVPDDVNDIALVKATADELVKGKETDLMRARALYDYTIDVLAYKKAGEGWGAADVAYACDARSGNCTDYHAYFIALARAAGIPARFAIGASIPSNRDEGGVDGYHCWAEFYADGKWWPVDISEADKFTSLSMYYFGHHPANRIELSRGQNLRVRPGPLSGPINFLAYPVLEVDGVTVRPQKFFSFKR